MLYLLAASCLFQPRSVAQAPCPPSSYITGVQFAPDSTIIRMAKGGDNWPVTWAADGYLYTTYGDGWGFEPKVPEKLGLGFARVEGMPPDIKGINIRSSGENKGSGRNGKKGTGILAIGKTIYLWLMHADEQGGQSQLAWSTDGLHSLEMSPWKFSEFGICSMINFGQDYRQARDRYVYSISHNGPRADTPGDGFILMRVPKNKLRKRKAYRFYAGQTTDGRVKWTKDIIRRVPVFEYAGHCQRSAICYNPGLERYLWWQQIPNFQHPDKDLGDTRFEGGFGLYEAPEPWGPWRTVYYTEQWDVGPGEMATFPVKWMSEDGKTCWLVFSGEDAFSVRKVVFEVQESGRRETSPF
ncbi:MAG: hypothetical protein R2824_12545 [Saprospiraceae bacterium]